MIRLVSIWKRRKLIVTSMGFDFLIPTWECILMHVNGYIFTVDANVYKSVIKNLVKFAITDLR